MKTKKFVKTQLYKNTQIGDLMPIMIKSKHAKMSTITMFLQKPPTVIVIQQPAPNGWYNPAPMYGHQQPAYGYSNQGPMF
jgi:hypothetical protein